MIRTMPLVSIVSLMLSAAACGTTKSEEVQDDRLAAVEAQADERAEAAERKQEAQVENAENAAEAQQDEADKLPGAYQDHAQAEIDNTQERQVYTASTRSRLEKIDIRLQEAARKASIKGEARNVELKEQLNAAKAQHDQLENELEEMGSVADERWESTVSRMDQQVDNLESRVDDLIEKVDEAA